MHLIELTLSGFKSFADRTTLRFSTGITAIIGPNGAGKSNLADAISWALGEQSLKNLRGQLAPDVIYSGNSDRGRVSRAQVALTFSNESKRLLIAEPEVTIKRTVDRSGEGEYLLNEDPTRLLDIVQLLTQAGLGTKSYAVISQGMVDQYITATPQARRELFDEATGIKSLQIKLAQAQKKLKIGSKMMQELSAIIEELGPRLNVLKRQIKREERRKALLQTIRDKKQLWYQMKWHKLNGNLKVIYQKNMASKNDVIAAKKQRTTIENKVFEAAQKAPTSEQENLIQKLTRAEQYLLTNRKSYQQSIRLREELKTTLVKLKKKYQQASADTQTVQHKTYQILYHGILNMLDQCLQTTKNIKTQKESRRHGLTILENLLNKAIVALKNPNDAPKIRQVIQELINQLEISAQLRANIDEISKNLTTLEHLKPPSDADVIKLRQQINKLKQFGPSNPTLEKLSYELNKARQLEINAEKNESNTATQKQQLQNELQELERICQRHLGTQYLATIMKSVPINSNAVSKNEIEKLDAELSTLGEIDPLAAREYLDVKERYEYLVNQQNDIKFAQVNTERLIKNVQSDIATSFKLGLLKINDSFNKSFQQLFGGGSAKLSIVTAASPIDSNNNTHKNGIEISVRLPGKAPRIIQLLSGGEKTMTALALILAILQVQCPPFIVLDEVDAALDDSNTQRFSMLLQEISKTTQCIVITHNLETMAKANVLYGVTMDQTGKSKTYSVRLENMLEPAKKQTLPT